MSIKWSVAVGQEKMKVPSLTYAWVGGNQIQVVKYDEIGWCVECLGLNITELPLGTRTYEQAKKRAPVEILRLLEQWTEEFQKAIGEDDGPKVHDNRRGRSLPARG